MKFDLSTKTGRYRARKAGLDVPKLRPGLPRPDFDAMLDKSGDCWLWLGRASRDGYGRYRYAGKQGMAHKYAWERVNGPVPDGLILRHSCDTPACCNPSHLLLGTQADNMRDKTERDRQAKGSDNGMSILTEAQVLELRARYKFRVCTYLMLADEFGLSKDTVQKAVRGIYWRHL